MSDFLEKIINHKRKRIDEAQKRFTLDDLYRRTGSRVQNKFKDSLTAKKFSVIAEIKRSSPSAGRIRADFDLVEQGRKYVAGGASAISVLTEEDYFGGSIEDLQSIRTNVLTTVLRKDFILTDYQVVETAFLGADALLLIAAILSKNELNHLHVLATEIGLNCVVEVHNEEDIEKVTGIPVSIIGINNRDLKTFKVDLETSIRLRPLLPESVVAVSESGIKSREDVIRLQEAGFNAILVGELLMRSRNPELTIKELLGTANGES